jgi:hypothetical protein
MAINVYAKLGHRGVAALLNTNRTKPYHNVSDTCPRIDHNYPSSDYYTTQYCLAQTLNIASNMNVIRNLLHRAPNPRKQSLTNNNAHMSSSIIPGPFLSFDDSCRELLVTWVPNSEHQALPGEHLRAELRHNSYIANYTTTLEEFELMILQPNDNACGMVRKPYGKAIFVELIWDAEDAANRNHV